MSESASRFLLRPEIKPPMPAVPSKLNILQAILVAVEFGFRAHEKGHNLQKTLEAAADFFTDQ